AHPRIGSAAPGNPLSVRLRAGWLGVLQAILFVIAFALIGVTISASLILVYVAVTAPTFQAGVAGLKTADGTQTLMQGLAHLAGFLTATVVIGKWALGWTFHDLRWTRGRQALTGAARGLALGAAAAALTLGAAVVLRTAFWSRDQGGLA